LNIGYDPMITGIKYKLKEYKLHMRDNDKTNPNNDDDQSNGMVLFDRIPNDYLEFVWPCVVGFSLSAKAWGDCLVDGLEDIGFNDDAFDRLVLSESRKRLVKALVKYSAASSNSIGSHGHGFHDLIAGKGEGTVFLLYGPPGVGKTLTAEAVAEVLKRPLFSVSMGTLGTTADDLEKRLGEILKLSAKWDAIILLDEADSFLETRSSTSSLERNAMVSVMLKLVEYFSGILFLTSNRFDSLDPAFQTRITLALAYENLDAPGREKVWSNLLSKSDMFVGGPVMIDTKELAQFPLNGREIKNALRLALALATEENRSLTQEILMDTVAMIKPVDKEGAGQGRNRFFSCQWWK
jgi:SpoVK/Ycf46/Vps4 family AAA+-type ATPase